MWIFFYEHIFNCLNSTIPKRKESKSDDRFPHWFSPNLIELIKSKSKAWQEIRDNKKNCPDANDHPGNPGTFKTPSNPECSSNHRNQFCEFRKTVKKEIRKIHRRRAADAEFSIKSDPKKLYSFFKNDKKESGGSFFFNNTFFDQPADIANEFAKFFQSTYNVSYDPNHVELDKSVFRNDSPINLISDEELTVALDHLKGSLVCGPDDIPSFIYKGCSDSLLSPIKHILNLCLINMEFPERWKISRITPIFKKGDKSVGENYRGISILSALSKILEIILHNRIYPIFANVVAPEQHGFVKGRSTTTNHFCFKEYLAGELLDNGEVHTVYFDFFKAFDRVNYNLLLQKLSERFDLPPYLICLFRSYLSGRVSYVSFHEVKSFIFSVLSGVPQGANLGPLLFLLFINDLPSCLHFALCLLFADDLKIFKSIKCEADMVLMQKDIDNVINWANENSLPINEAKCQLIIFSKTKSRFENVQYVVGNSVITPQDSVVDLGVIFDSKLTFNDHIRSMISNANKSLGYIIRSSHSFREISTMTLLYSSFVRSKLEFASTIWHRDIAAQSEKIEKVQKKFLRYLYYRKHGVYPHYSRHPVRTADMQKEFNILSLQNRRVLNDALFIYRIFNNHINCSELLSRFIFNTPIRRTRQTTTIFYPPLSPLVRLDTPSARLMNLINDLYDNIEDMDLFFMSPSNFKISIVNYLTDL